MSRNYYYRPRDPDLPGDDRHPDSGRREFDRRPYGYPPEQRCT